MGEHVGQHNYPVYAAQLHRLLRPQGRLLLQQMSRGAAGANNAPGGGPFMERYVAPDMHMRPLGATLSLLEAAGLEVVDVHSLREHYVWTVRPWLDTLQERRAEAVALIGEEQYRVWLLYLAGAALAFAENRMGVHQVLLVRPGRRRAVPACPAGAAPRSGRDPELDRSGQRLGAPAQPSRHDEPVTDYPWAAGAGQPRGDRAVVVRDVRARVVRRGPGARRPARRDRRGVGRRLRHRRAGHAGARASVQATSGGSC